MNQLEGGNILEYVNPYLQVISTSDQAYKPQGKRNGKYWYVILFLKCMLLENLI